MQLIKLVRQFKTSFPRRCKRTLVPMLQLSRDTSQNAFNNSTPFPGYNQSGLVDDQDLIFRATQYANSGFKPPESDITQSLVLIPAYTIQTYNSTQAVQAWISAAGQGASNDHD
ncbi:hypothetical protein D9757_007393 [Collybiopsis confluens]|uniref:Uncharacterized protein n=1 Tax=Collybiopsis confluens TaxID=2823264 RepID=A0A8H5M7V2_9AGAR|nr:hypothetical protein D9757_007398 [Collybiopsis confluens]KAF5383941.1 hypothetical protein D9757_007393 [Collybiopsis confluens]